jgi:alpha-L-rhamnosidase
VCQEARVDWGAAIVLIPYYLYLYEGDIRVFKDFYPHMKDFITYVIKYEDKNGIIQNGYGDWCPPRGNDKMECPPELTSTAFFYGVLAILNNMAAILGDHDYAAWCWQKMITVKNNFNKTYLTRIKGTDYWTYGSQTGIVIAYRMGLIPDEKLASVKEGLLYDIKELHQGHISTGIHGQRIYSVLCDMGKDEVAYSILTIPSFPSLAYTISSGQTTWPETPFEYKDRSRKWEGSFNHPMNSGFAVFFHDHLGGIRPLQDAPGFKHFEVRPHLLDQLRWASTDFVSPYGRIVSNWKTNNNKFTIEVMVPCNTTASVYVPSKNPETISEGNKSLSQIRGIRSFTYKDGFTILELGSGNYHFTSFK